MKKTIAIIVSLVTMCSFAFAYAEGVTWHGAKSAAEFIFDFCGKKAETSLTVEDFKGEEAVYLRVSIPEEKIIYYLETTYAQTAGAYMVPEKALRDLFNEEAYQIEVDGNVYFNERAAQRFLYNTFGWETVFSLEVLNLRAKDEVFFEVEFCNEDEVVHLLAEKLEGKFWISEEELLGLPKLLDFEPSSSL